MEASLKTISDLYAKHESANNERFKETLSFGRAENVSDSIKSDAFAMSREESKRRSIDFRFTVGVVFASLLIPAIVSIAQNCRA